MIHWRRKVRQTWGRINGTGWGAVGPSGQQEQRELQRDGDLVHGRASVVGLSSPQETFSGVCLKGMLDTNLISPRKSSVWGRAAVVYDYFVPHYVPAHSVPVLLLELRERQVCLDSICWRLG